MNLLHTPTLFPRLLLALAATAVALVAPLWAAASLAALAAFVLLRHGTGDTARAAGWMVIGLSAATILMQTLILALALDRGWVQSAAVGASFSVRLGAVLLVATATSVVLPPRAWLASLARFPRLALLLTLVFRQVPDVAAEAERVKRAQKARGLLVGRTVPALASVAPVMSRTLERADRMGRVLYLSGWGRPRRDPLVRPMFQMVDLLWLGIAFVVFAWLFVAA